MLTYIVSSIELHFKESNPLLGQITYNMRYINEHFLRFSMK